MTSTILHTLNSTLSGELDSVMPVSITARSLTVAVDPRMELLSIIQFLGQYPTKFPPVMTKHGFSYRTDVEATFASFRDHEAVRIFDQLSQRDYTPEAPAFYFGAPPEAMLYLLSDFTLHPDIHLNQFLVNRAGGRQSLERFVAALQAFSREADFSAFYTSHLSYYQQIVHMTTESIGSKGYVEILEAFYGQRQKSYTLLLVSLYGSVGYGPHLECADGSRNVYSILGPKAIESALPTFGNQSYFDRMLIHELSHPFINPLTEKHRAAVDRLERADLTAEVGAKSGYGEWYDVVNEYIIRAITAHFAYLESKDRGDQELANAEGKGFRFVDRLLGPIEEYTQNRHRYESFGAFYPELVHTLAQAE